MSESLLELRALSKQYQRAGQRIIALDSVSLRVNEGEVVGLLGPNGSGKTTLIKLTTSLTEPTSGEVLFRGMVVRNKNHLGKLGVLLEGRGSLNERLTTWENARWLCGLRGERFESGYFKKLSSLLEIDNPHVPVRLLSTGNKLRSALLTCLIHRPHLVLLDEPTIGLDLFGVDQLGALVRRCIQTGTSFIISSHDLSFIERLSHRIVCLRRGRLIFDGCKSAFLHIDHCYVLTLEVSLKPPPQLPIPLRWSVSNNTLTVRIRDHAELCQVLSALLPALPDANAIRVEQVSVRDKYAALVSDFQTAE